MDGRNRSLRERVDAAWRDEASHHCLTRWIFVRLIGAIYLIAFGSLWLQLDGLIGHNGINPAGSFLEAVRQQTGSERFWLLPTLCWFNGSDGFLHFLCGGGMAAGLLIMGGIFQGPALLVAWMFYLSLFGVGREFLGFQWDILLLETGFLAILFAPWRWRSQLTKDAPPSRLVLWLLRWLLFRLMFASGVVKLTSGDPLWRNLTALSVHYETQPLPTWIGWHAHQMPGWFHQGSVAVMFFVELAVPWLIFAPRRFRMGAFAIFLALQVGIILTGNYCFFNLLTVALSITLLDDRAIRRLCPAKWRMKIGEVSEVVRAPQWRRLVVALVGGPLLLLGAVQMVRLFVPVERLPAPMLNVLRVASPFCLVNSYGLFAVMTTPRMEIEVEGSNDGVKWEAYAFRWKPGDLRRAPSLVAPHQPRLDWQMWFAALGNYQGNPWFTNFLVRLLQGKTEVTALLAKNPFPDKPPRYVRAQLYEYHFTDAATRGRTGEWWRRELKGLYCPPLTLQGSAP